MADETRDGNGWEDLFGPTDPENPTAPEHPPAPEPPPPAPTPPPGQPDPPEAPHLNPVGRGGHHRGPVVATHRLCNQRLGTKAEAPEMNQRHARRW